MRLQGKLEEQGFTLVEIMVATAITSVIVLAGMAALTMTGKAVRANEQTSDAQQSARMAMEMITHDIKMAGFGPQIDPSKSPPPVGNCGIGGTPVPILPGDNNPVVGAADTGPDQISLMVPLTFYGGPGVPPVPPPWQTNGPFGPGVVANVAINAAILPAMTAAGFGAGSYISLGGAVLYRVQGAAAPIQLTIPEPGPTTVIPTGTQIFLLQCITYQVIPQLAGGAPGADLFGICGGNAPCLVRGVANATVVASFGRVLPNCNVVASPCVPIVNGIEDLQFAYACDGCRLTVPPTAPDGLMDDLNPIPNNIFDQPDYISDPIWSNNPPMTPSAIKMVQVTIVARQQSIDNGLGEGNSQTGPGTLSTTFLAVDDHPHASGVFIAGDAGAQVPPYASVRRRVLTRTVETRNARPWS
jgi:type IV pilus assembly protein PilW